MSHEREIQMTDPSDETLPPCTDFITKYAQNAPKSQSNAKLLGASMGYKTVKYLFYTKMFINCADMTNLLNIKAP